MTTESPGATLQRIPDNIRAEMARRRVDGTVLAERLGMSYSTFKRRMSSPGTWTARDLVNLAAQLQVPLTRLINGEQ